MIVGSEVALAVVLLVVAGLVTRSFRELMNVDPGFRRAGVVSFRLELPRDRYADNATIRAFTNRLDERVRALPGVQSSGRVLRVPLSTFNFNVGFSVDGRTTVPRGANDLHAGLAPEQVLEPEASEPLVVHDKHAKRGPGRP